MHKWLKDKTNLYKHKSIINRQIGQQSTKKTNIKFAYDTPERRQRAGQQDGGAVRL